MTRPARQVSFISVLSMLLLGGVAFGAASGAANRASAHIDLLDPPSRNAEQKNWPCGKGGLVDQTGEGAVTRVVEAGSDLVVQWDETIGHLGYYRIALIGDVGQIELGGEYCEAPADHSAQEACYFAEDKSHLVTADGSKVVYVDDPAGSQGVSQQTVTIDPNLRCENCTLQLIQYMTENGRNQTYFRCSDLKVVGPGEPIDNPEADAGVPAPTDGGVPEADPGTDETRYATGGCTVAPASTTPSGFGLFAMVALALGFLRRRR